jgi:small subunit ribosomal protein S1
VHVSELSWKHVEHPSEVATVGQEVEVEVLDVDLDRERVSLSLKATQEDPWREFERKNQTGEVITGQVTKLVPFGAFVRVGEGVEGLVHISELAREHVESPEEVVQVGEQVRVKVVDVDVSRRRISLSIKRVGDEVAAEPEIEAEVEAEVESEPEPAAPVGGIEVPQEVVDAVPDAPEEPAAAAPVAEPVAAPEEPAAPAAPAAAAPAAPAAAEEAGEAASEEDVSLEAILEDLKRREGRSS